MVNMNKLIAPSIYALYSVEGVFAYVGTTKKNSLNRLWEHRYRARTGHTAPVYAWMREVGADTVKVIDLVRLEIGDAFDILEAEMIAKLIDEGHPLTNQKSRDGRVNSMSSESKTKIGLTNAGVTTWITGKKGEEAGWTNERRKAQGERLQRNLGR